MGTWLKDKEPLGLQTGWLCFQFPIKCELISLKKDTVKVKYKWWPVLPLQHDDDCHDLLTMLFFSIFFQNVTSLTLFEFFSIQKYINWKNKSHFSTKTVLLYVQHASFIGCAFITCAISYCFIYYKRNYEF